MNLLYKLIILLKKNICSSRIMGIQEEMCERAIELLLLPEDQSCLLLDIGCGSGLSGDVLEHEGHTWIGIDISSAMLGKYSSNYILFLIFLL